MLMVLFSVMSNISKIYVVMLMVLFFTFSVFDLRWTSGTNQHLNKFLLQHRECYLYDITQFYNLLKRSF
jgi:hypothetical protein